MKFKDYIENNKIHYKDAATELGKHPKYINGVINGRILPGWKLVLKIEEWSKNQITRSDLRPDLWPPETV